MDVFIIIGNGFSIDFVNHIKKSEDISLSNLFLHGEKIKWPVDNKLGFLSYKHCPALWRLGARPTNTPDASNKIIQDIITCANVYVSLDLSKRQKITDNTASTYLIAYNELVSYLRQLFIYYNDSIDDAHLSLIDSWSWAKMIRKYYSDPNVTKIYIVTYNYDIWLERILKKLTLDFSVFLGEHSNEKIEIFKPHGSISFVHKKTLDIDAFEFKNNFDNDSAEIDNFDVKYTNLICNPYIIPIIPPAGQSSRYEKSWAASIRKGIEGCIKKSKEEDLMIIGGLSYNYVDREEIDEIIVNSNNNMDVYCVNPNPNEEFFAVLTTIYRKLVFLPKLIEI